MIAKSSSNIPFLIAALAILLLAPTVASAEVEVRTMSQTFALGSANQIDLDLTFGTVRVEGTDNNFVSVDVRLECNRQDLDKCERRANRLFLAPRISGKRMDIALRGTSRAQLQGIRAEMTVRMPRHFGLEVDMRLADVTISGMEADIEVDGVEGSVDITSTQNTIRTVDAKVGAGQVDLWVDGANVEGSGFPRSVKWEGSGQHKIELDMAAGDVDIKLN